MYQENLYGLYKKSKARWYSARHEKNKVVLHSSTLPPPHGQLYLLLSLVPWKYHAILYIFIRTFFSVSIFYPFLCWVLGIGSGYFFVLSLNFPPLTLFLFCPIRIHMASSRGNPAHLLLLFRLTLTFVVRFFIIHVSILKIFRIVCE